MLGGMKRMKEIIKLENVSVKFKNKELYSNINFSVEKGKCIGFIGMNGAGKSVLFQVISGLMKPTNGNVWVNGTKLGVDENDFPDNVGILINQPGYIDYYSGLKNLKLLAQIKNIITENEIIETLKLVGLNPEDKTPVKKYSTGMKQKLGIAQAIMENQDIIVLDEPYNALDYQTNRDITALLKKLKNQGKTILLTSHQHEYLEHLCDTMYFIGNGTIVNFDDEMKKKYFEAW